MSVGLLSILARAKAIAENPTVKAGGTPLLIALTIWVQVTVSDVQTKVGDQGAALLALKEQVTEYRNAATQEDVRLAARIDNVATVLGSRLDNLQSRVDAQQASIDAQQLAIERDLTEWREYWRRFVPALDAWLGRQSRARRSVSTDD